MRCRRGVGRKVARFAPEPGLGVGGPGSRWSHTNPWAPPKLGHTGPVGALTVCADEAQGIAACTSRSSGVTVGRSSLRLRNGAKNASPAWVDEWLRARGERSAAGVEGLTAFAEGPDGRVARVIKPLVVEAPCLVCHGAAEGLAPELRAALQARYPDDRATGYSVGDLRGALWAEAPVRASP